MKTAAANQRQPKQTKQTKKLAKDGAEARSITNKVMEMIALDNQPFSIVEDRGFPQLGEHIEARYSLSSWRFFSDISLPALHEVVAPHIHMCVCVYIYIHILISYISISQNFHICASLVNIMQN